MQHFRRISEYGQYLSYNGQPHFGEVEFVRWVNFVPPSEEQVLSDVMHAEYARSWKRNTDKNDCGLVRG